MASAKRADSDLKNELAKQLQSQLGEDGPQIQVDVVDGQATLAGTVGSSDSHEAAEKIAKGIDGIDYVANNLRVAQEGTTGATG